MSLAKINTAAVIGIDGYAIVVEADLANGLPSFQIVGLADNAVREAKDRVRSAIKNSGFQHYQHRITVNLAPADLRKEGSSFDLPIALALLAAQGDIPESPLQTMLFVGELSLEGKLRPAPGVLSIAASCKQQGISTLVVPMENATEAALVPDTRIIGVESLAQVIAWLNNDIHIEPTPMAAPQKTSSLDLDYQEVRGQEAAKRAITVAVAGGHNLLMVGPPGSGKTMLAARMPTIMPDMVFHEMLETTKLYSISGHLEKGQSLKQSRPFRAPHHSISDAGLVGGGTIPRPGEVSLANNGVLFLDELLEFKRPVIEMLRQPLEDRLITLSRANIQITYPARFMLVASLNPCPCGFRGDEKRQCSCTEQEVHRYLSRLSGPILDRIDIQIAVPSIRYKELNKATKTASSEELKQLVTKTRTVQQERYQNAATTNAEMSSREQHQHCSLGTKEHHLLEKTVDSFGFSARAVTRILKVARTIADLEGSEQIGQPHIAEAIRYRTPDLGLTRLTPTEGLMDR